MRPITRTKPYRNVWIVAAIRSLFFGGGTNSFANCFRHIFPLNTTLDGVMTREVPIPMVALVATAVSLFTQLV